MADIRCRRCGEPWDGDGARHGDMKHYEYQRFMKGEGCPSCAFGTECPGCTGTGRTPNYRADCKHCKGSRYLVVWRILDQREWLTGYMPNVTILDPQPEEHQLRRLSRELVRITSGPEIAAQAIIDCPHCLSTSSPCIECGGSGDLRMAEELQSTLDNNFGWDLMEGTDEDITEFLMEAMW